MGKKGKSSTEVIWSTHPLLLSCLGGCSQCLCLPVHCSGLHRRGGWGGDPASLTDTDHGGSFLILYCFGKLKPAAVKMICLCATPCNRTVTLVPTAVCSHWVPCGINVTVSIWTHLWIWLRLFVLTGTLLWSSLPSDPRQKWKAEKQLLMMLPQTSWGCWWSIHILWG